MSEINERIKQRRKELGLTQRDLASMVGCSQMQIWRYEMGSNDPTAKVVVRLAQALQVSLNWLLDLDETRVPQPLKIEPPPQPVKIDEQEQELLRLYHAKSPKLQKKLIEIARVL